MERPKRSKRTIPPRKLPTWCLSCGAENPWVVQHVDMSAPFRDAVHQFRAEVHQCRHCDAVTTTEEQSAAISAQVEKAHQKWVTDRFKATQSELGLSLRELADKIRIPFATLGRISSGGHSIEATTEKLLWMELDKLARSQALERLLRIERPSRSVMDGVLMIHCDPKIAEVYGTFTRTPPQSPIGRSCAREWVPDFSEATEPEFACA